MNDCLFIPASAGGLFNESTPLYWQQATGQGERVQWPACAEQLAGRRLALVLPMDVVSACTLSVPTHKARWLRKALPYAVEENLAEDVELLHLTVGEPTSDGQLPVRAVLRSVLRGWLEQMSAHNIQVVAVWVDADLLPADGCQVLLHGERALLGGDTAQRLVFTADTWSGLAITCPDAQVTIDHDPWQLLASGQAQGINLAQGEFVIRQRSGTRSKWYSLASVVGMWLVLQLSFDIGRGVYLQHQGHNYASASSTLYHELFPEDQRIVNLKAQFDEHLQNRTHGRQADFFGLLGAAAAALQQSAHTSVQQVEFNQQRGDLVLQLRATDFVSLEALRQQLLQSGVAAHMGSATSEGTGVSARITLGGEA